jgi:arylformamidase
MIYDISQPVFESSVYPGDPEPIKELLTSLADGDVCNLTAFSMCAHNGTHVDAPLHFLKDGKGIGSVALEKLVGPAYVGTMEGDVGAEEAKALLEKAAIACSGAERRILIKGNATVTLEAAEVFARAGIDLIGNESQTVGPEDAPMAVHLALLSKEVVLLEGVRLSAVPDGAYLLNCAPLNLGETDGAPCRAILMDL